MGLPAQPTHPTRPSVAHEERNADQALDWLFCNGGSTSAKVVLCSVIKDMCALSSDDDDERQVMGVQPSDHMPVMAVYRL